MGAKGRKRKAKRKAPHRTGLLKQLTGDFSQNQRKKRAKRKAERSAYMAMMERRLFGGGFW